MFYVRVPTSSLINNLVTWIPYSFRMGAQPSFFLSMGRSASNGVKCLTEKKLQHVSCFFLSLSIEGALISHLLVLFHFIRFCLKWLIPTPKRPTYTSFAQIGCPNGAECQSGLQQASSEMRQPWHLFPPTQCYVGMAKSRRAAVLITTLPNSHFSKCQECLIGQFIEYLGKGN